jgi:hypothetical protein
MLPQLVVLMLLSMSAMAEIVIHHHDYANRDEVLGISMRKIVFSANAQRQVGTGAPARPEITSSAAQDRLSNIAGMAIP